MDSFQSSGQRVNPDQFRILISITWNSEKDDITETNNLSSSVISLAFLTLQDHFKNEDIAFVPSEFFDQPCASMNFVLRGNRIPKVVLLPRCYQDHWTIWCLNVEEWNLTHYDSLKAQESKDLSSHIIQDQKRILTAARVTFGVDKMLRTAFPLTPEGYVQKDGFNSGAYVIIFADKLMESGRIEVSTEWDPSVGRAELAAMFNQKKPNDLNVGKYNEVDAEGGKGKAKEELIGKSLNFDDIKKSILDAWQPEVDNVFGNNFLSGSLITLCLREFQLFYPNAKDVVFVDSAFFCENLPVINFTSKSDEPPKIVLFPRCFDVHWTLWCLDVDSWTLVNFDPLRGVGQSVDVSCNIPGDFQKIRDTAQATFGNKENPKLKFGMTPKSITQRDACNCGVYILWMRTRISTQMWLGSPWLSTSIGVLRALSQKSNDETTQNADGD
ncbi:hypothetical protein L596_028285 [Steinernema carpocapsae]|uniref:Ubiquitin-like protease family profile domain-containing protein n=1 Tax=Steinernema carpocapsae TaxID=34508 RepID=A0A4U5LY25_STECR|nr:hypothetical protein L596_028285 [Steinernema carpocapsae]